MQWLNMLDYIDLIKYDEERDDDDDDDDDRDHVHGILDNYDELTHHVRKFTVKVIGGGVVS